MIFDRRPKDLVKAVRCRVIITQSYTLTHLAWTLSVDVNFQLKTETVSVTYANENSNVAVFDLNPPDGDYFLVKNSKYVGLFDNTIELAFGVIDTMLNVTIEDTPDYNKSGNVITDVVRSDSVAESGVFGDIFKLGNTDQISISHVDVFYDGGDEGDDEGDDDPVDVTFTNPEPSTIALLGLGMLGGVFARRQRRTGTEAS